MTAQPLVIKIGGNELSSPEYIAELAGAIAELQKTYACILVHGGGKAVSDLMARLDIAPVFVDGQRMTDEAALAVTEMVLSGQVNKTLVLALLDAGLDAAGLSGIDRSLLRVEPWSAEMGRVGRIVEVRSAVLLDMCARGIVPVVSPISFGPGGKYNVNADHAAGAIAGATGAAQVVFITNVPGVFVGANPVRQMSAAQIEAYISDGTIHGGMIPKVRAATAALELGSRAATITDLPGLKKGGGTTITAQNGANE